MKKFRFKSRLKFRMMSPLLWMGVLASASAAAPLTAWGDPLPVHQLPAAKNGGTVIGNCDGKSSVEVPNTHGQPLPPAQAQAVANQLMDQWKVQHPDVEWILASNDTPTQESLPSKGDAAPASKAASDAMAQMSKQQMGTYSNFTDADRKVWSDETLRFIGKGNEIFHSDKLIGGKTGIACAMCHPGGSNTHPETYPKYQVQLGRVALLRDMINWCIENPVKGTAFKDDDVRLRQLEAYILSTRKGTPLEFGKH